jgi:hypothetical protein
MNNFLIRLIFFICFCSTSFANSNNESLSSDANFCILLPNPNNIASNISEIQIEIFNEKKFARNLLDASVFSKKMKGVLGDQFKKWFDGKLFFEGSDKRTCEYEIKIRLLGDYLDHVNFNSKNGLSNSGWSFSTSIKVKEGSIGGLTEFKAFKASARHEDNEILGHTLASMLGFIAPDTVALNINMLGHSQRYLIQESINQKFIENNINSSIPLLEGDERLKMLWYKQSEWLYEGGVGFESGNFSIPSDIRYSLGRLTNAKWAIKDKTNFENSIDALDQLNQAYIEFLERTKTTSVTGYYPRLDFSILAGQNSSSLLLWREYEAFLDMVSVGHALIPTNQQFYYDPSLESVLPILYDSMIIIQDPFDENYNLERFSADSIIGSKTLISKFKDISSITLWENLKERNAHFSLIQVEAILERIINNLEVLSNHSFKELKQKKITSDYVFFGNYPYNFNKDKRLVYSDNSQLFIECEPLRSNCQQIKLKNKKLVKLLSGRLSKGEKYYIYIGKWDN